MAFISNGIPKGQIYYMDSLNFPLYLFPDRQYGGMTYEVTLRCGDDITSYNFSFSCDLEALHYFTKKDLKQYKLVKILNVATKKVILNKEIEEETEPPFLFTVPEKWRKHILKTKKINGSWNISWDIPNEMLALCPTCGAAAPLVLAKCPACGLDFV